MGRQAGGPLVVLGSLTLVMGCSDLGAIPADGPDESPDAASTGQTGGSPAATTGTDTGSDDDTTAGPTSTAGPGDSGTSDGTDGDPPVAQICAVPTRFATIADAISDRTCAQIQIAAGTFSERLVIDRDVVIRGALGATVVDAQGLGTVLTVTDGAVELHGLTITGGVAERGAGIDNEGDLVVTQCAVTGNLAASSGAIGGGIATTGPLRVTNSDISHNIAHSEHASDPARGGGIHATDAAVTIVGSTIEGNAVSGGGPAEGGGVWVAGETVDIIDSALRSNVARSQAGIRAVGGGLVVDGSVATLSAVELTDNHAVVDAPGAYAAGGGLAAFGAAQVHVDAARIADNHAHARTDQSSAFGGAIAFEGFGGSGRLDVLRTDVHRNFARVSGSGERDLAWGGSIAVRTTDELAALAVRIDASVVRGGFAQGPDSRGGGIGFDVAAGLLSAALVNATVDGNEAVGPSASGGAVFIAVAPAGRFDLDVRSTTVTANQAGLGGGGLASDVTGGIASVSVDNSIFGGNGASLAADLMCAGDLQPIVAHSVFEDPSGCPVIVRPGFFVGDAQLGPLADNGGPTVTRSPLPGSAVVDAGAATGCTGPAGEMLGDDQRGWPRHMGSACDLGAVERQD